MQLDMAKQKKINDIEVVEPKIIKTKAKPTKPKHKTKLYPLICDVEISGKVVKKGTKHPLTEKGAKYFKSKNYIK